MWFYHASGGCKCGYYEGQGCKIGYLGRMRCKCGYDETERCTKYDVDVHQSRRCVLFLFLMLLGIVSRGVRGDASAFYIHSLGKKFEILYHGS